jgi:hypothetical protein
LTRKMLDTGILIPRVWRLKQKRNKQLHRIALEWLNGRQHYKTTIKTPHRLVGVLL